MLERNKAVALIYACAKKNIHAYFKKLGEQVFFVFWLDSFKYSLPLKDHSIDDCINELKSIYELDYSIPLKLSIENIENNLDDNDFHTIINPEYFSQVFDEPASEKIIKFGRRK